MDRETLRNPSGRRVLRSVLSLLASVLVGGHGSSPTATASDRAVGAGEARLKWLAEPGAESLTSGRAADAGQVILASVPGAAFLFAVDERGSLQKLKRIAADSSAAYGVAGASGRAVVAGRDGSVVLWTLSSPPGPTQVWRAELAERVASVAWDGGRVLAATWNNRLLALDGKDGRSLWSVDIGGKADAPPVTDGRDVFVATKSKALLRLDAATGAVRWKKALPGPVIHPPVVLAGTPRTIVCGTWNGHLLAYDATSGEPRWTVPLTERLAAAPVAAADTVAVATADGVVRAYSGAGVPRWTAPAASQGPGVLLLRADAQGSPRLLAISNVLVALDLARGRRLTDYPRGAVDDLRRRFAAAMVDGVKTYSEGERRALAEQEAFDIAGPVFGPARAFGGVIGFGTEEGWMYLFDAGALRPAARYRAGPSCESAPLVGGNVLAVGGEEVFALEGDTGRLLWRRNVGAEAGRVVTRETVGVFGGGRLNVLSAASGVVEWTLRGRFRSVSPQPATPSDTSVAAPPPWLADDGEGNLRALLPSGLPAGDPLPQGGDLLPVAAAGGRSWVAATRDGTVFGVGWDGARLSRDWEMALGERLADLRVAGGKLVLRTEAGALVGLDLLSRQESWRLRLDAEDRYQALPGVGALVVLGGRTLRVLDLATGEQRSSHPLPVPAVGAELRDGALVWLDRAGKAFRVGVEGAAVPSGDVGTPLAGADAVPHGFLVTTAAGEIGFVEWIDSETPAGSGPGSQTGGRR
jgi:outer membrane protein assembly factor BamB